MSFQNKVVWITGASSGIGEELVYAFSKAGAKLIISSRKEQELNLIKAKCTNSKDVIVLTLDLGKFDSLSEKTEEALKHYGKIDILINNGGISQRSPALETKTEVEQQIMNINFFGTVALSKSVLPSMIKQKSGHIVVVSSLVGKFGSPLRSAYSASKHALHGYFDSLRAEIWKENIDITIICPGFVKTNISLNAMTGDGIKYGKMDTATEKGIPARECAEQMLGIILERKEEAVIGGTKEKTGLFLKRFAPSVFSKVIKNAKVT